MLPRSSSSMQDKTFRSADREVVGGGSLMASYSGQPENKITRSNLVDQLREYQIRSKHDWASMSFFSSTSNPSYSRSNVYALKLEFNKSSRLPATVKAVRGFLGLTGYYRWFVRNYGILARPLTTLTKKDGFQWTDIESAAFEMLKQALVTAPVLRLPDFSIPFTVECDASSEGVGAILIQDDHPIAYFSKGFALSTRFKSAYDRELLALVLDVQKWNHYLLGRHFFIRTDHFTLKYLLEQRVTTSEKQRLLLKLMPYDFTIINRSGKENRGADALSRRPRQADLLTLAAAPFCSDIMDIYAGLGMDPYTKDIMASLATDPNSVPGFTMVGQSLLYKGHLVVPDHLDLRARILHEAHSTPMAGHGGFLKTMKKISSHFYWPKLAADVRLFVQNCQVCQRNKYETLSPAWLLQPLPIPEQIWEDLSMDFIVGLPPSNRMDTIPVVIDRLSKYAHFLPLSHPFTAKTVATIFCKEIEYSYNTGFHSATRSTPFNVVFGRDPPALHPYVSDETKNADLEAQLIDQDDMLKLLKINLSKAQSLAYELELPPTSRIHPVFHISLLKPAKSVVPPPQPAPLPLTRDWEYDVQPASVAAHRWVLEAGQPVLELLIHWQNRPIEEATWECYDLLKNQFPTFRLADKSSFGEGSIVTNNTPVRVYQRRNRKKTEQAQIQLLDQLKIATGLIVDPLSHTSG
ncbi:hypothetical protein E3N88_40262 [Mikania micrantha]|uniref:Integrase zinc-binding domain-containing protein n=1 Tax=Mikania micrantha TaxID=192012 RepID=A0A5N6LM86_9ASTR|nr:hypothetical protein E3N88_40262 [Mikania micrantha]